MEISVRVRALLDYVIEARSGHGCKLMPRDTEYLLDELMGIHTSISILESSPGVNKKLHDHAIAIYPPRLDPVLLAHGGTITTYQKPSLLTPLKNLFKRRLK
ncbi:MAG: hypothetical protein COA47_17390 [Robiginitomaculum sp.]|nr:MAG: hypothetical protein COA47_17390 [Robiginitomaculum sp.]